MQFITAKKSSDIKLAGIKAELDITDKSVNGVTFTDAEGNVVRVSLRSYSMAVEVPAPPVMVKRYKVAGKLMGLTVNEMFDDAFNAEVRVEELTRLSTNADLGVQEVEIPEEQACTADADDLPF
ncbi:hypothetical protein ACOTJG_13685 [Achromobacter xylosoxidans]